MMAPVPVQAEIWAPALPEAAAATSPTSASLQVSLPSDARLVVGDFDTQSAGSVRQFESPALVEGKTYAYELRAELNRDGRTITETKTIVIQPGQTVHVDFTLDGTQLAQANER